MNKLLRNMPVTIHSNRINTDNFPYVGDIAFRFDIILHKEKVRSIYNIRGENEKLNIDVTKDLLCVLSLSGLWSYITELPSILYHKYGIPPCSNPSNMCIISLV